MTTALWIIAICELVRIVQNAVQLIVMLHDHEDHADWYDALHKSLQLTDSEFEEALRRCNSK